MAPADVTDGPFKPESMALPTPKPLERRFDSFPFDPYSIQSEFMTALYDALEAKRIGLFESPTGASVLGITQGVALKELGRR